MILDHKGILVIGGTGSLGQVLVKRLLAGEWGEPRFVRVFSRDEAKQHRMRSEIAQSSDEESGLLYRSIAGGDSPLQFVIGDVRDKDALKKALVRVNVVFNAAALKQVPACEYFPIEAAKTNVMGAATLVQAVLETFPRPDAVVGISTDKACKPVNVMGMTKALQERIYQKANLEVPEVRFVCVRYGNVLASRGSVVPLFHHQIAKGGPVTVTDNRMTRFFLTLDRAVDTVIEALAHGCHGETWVPRVPSAKIVDLALTLIAELDPDVTINMTEIRPGEKLHEELVSTEEASRTVIVNSHYLAIRSVLPEVRKLSRYVGGNCFLDRPLSSEDHLVDGGALKVLLEENGLLEPAPGTAEEVLR